MHPHTTSPKPSPQASYAIRLKAIFALYKPVYKRHSSYKGPEAQHRRMMRCLKYVTYPKP